MSDCLFLQNNPRLEEGRNPWCSQIHLMVTQALDFHLCTAQSTTGQERTQSTGTLEAVLIDFYATTEKCLLICNFSQQWTSGVLLFIASGKMPTIKPIFTKSSRAWHAECWNKGKKLRMIQVFVLWAFVSLSPLFVLPHMGLWREKPRRTAEHFVQIIKENMHFEVTYKVKTLGNY